MNRQSGIFVKPDTEIEYHCNNCDEDLFIVDRDLVYCDPPECPFCGSTETLSSEAKDENNN